jgi:hypothetical protein
MTHTETITTKIVVMDDHFLYLPLFYAKHRDFYGFIPPHYKVDIVKSADKTDISAFKMLMDVSSSRNADINFAVCDPACVLTAVGTSPPIPIVLAELISNTAFWAVDRTDRPASFLSELTAFKNIISFKPGTTSYGIASRIVREGKGNHAPTIRPVDPGHELVRLRTSERSTVALSPDILGIDHLLFNNAEFKIYLALGNTPEYSSVLLTGLMTRDDVFHNHKELTLGLLEAIQQSMILTKNRMPDVMKYADDRFGPFGEDLVRKAFDRADEAHVFPDNIVVKQAHWMNAADVAADSMGCPCDKTEALHVFHQHIAPYSHLTQQAVSKVYGRVADAFDKRQPKPQIWKTCLSIAGWIAAGAATMHWIHWSAPITLLVAIAVGMYSARLISFKEKSPGLYGHWALIVVAVVSILGRIGFQWDRWFVWSAIIAVVVGEITIIHIELQGRGQ